MLCNLKEAARIAIAENSGLPAFNVFGYEDAAAVISAAERMNRPVVLMTNKVAVAHMGIPVLAGMLLEMARRSEVPTCVHLDHATELADIRQAVDSGYTSVMIDGSQLPFDENVAVTRAAVEIARPRGVSVEAEIGSVGYSDNADAKRRFTDPGEAERFAALTGVDALAVAVGTVHRMETQGVDLQFDLLRRICQVVKIPLVIHGSTGVADRDLRRLIECGAVKINMGTTLRMVFGQTLREQIEENPKLFDRVEMYQKCMKAVEGKAIEKIKCL